MIADRIKETASRRKTVFTTAEGATHDRNHTVGGSEIWSCLRRTWFAKHQGEADPGHADAWGFFERGHVVEDWVVSTVHQSLDAGDFLKYAGQDQRTLVDGNVSATPDGLLIIDTTDVVLEIKSLDPRSNLHKAKPQHVYQAQLQIELFNKLTEHQPERAILLYVNASDFSDIVEHEVLRDPGVLASAHRRADQVFDAKTSTELPAEGIYADECRYCPYTDACGTAVVREFPEHKTTVLPEPLAAEFDVLVEEYNNLDAEIAELKRDKGRVNEDIKLLLRESNLKSANTEDWSISYALVSGRASLDKEAVEDAGIDLSPYYKRGRDSERLTIKVKN